MKNYEELEDPKYQKYKTRFSKPHEDEVHKVPELNNKTVYLTIICGSLPLIITFCAFFSTRFIMLFFLKEQTDDSVVINANGISFTWTALTCIGLFYALNVGMGARIAQAFGAKKFELIGYFVHRSFIINCIVLVFIIMAIIFSEEIFTFLNFSAEAIPGAARVLKLQIPGDIGFVLENMLMLYLFSCQKFLVIGVVLFIGSGFFVGMAYLFVIHLDLGLDGAAYSFDSLHIFNFLMLLLYVLIWNPIPGTIFCFKEKSFKGIWDLFKFEVFSGSMVFFESVGEDLVGIFAASLSAAQLEANTIVASVYLLAYPFMTSLSQMTQVFVGKSMGELKVSQAKKFLKCCLVVSLCTWVIVETVFIIFREQIIKLFSTNDANYDYAIKTFEIYLLIFPFEFSQTIFGAGLRASGKERAGSLCMLLAQYGIGIPATYILGIQLDWGVEGLAIGYGIGVVLKLIFFLIVYSRFNWQRQLAVIKEELNKKYLKISVSEFKEEPLYKEDDDDK